MQLPASGGLPVQLLASCFNYTSATYKYYWLLSIIQAVENHQTTIDKKVLFARMLANAWYTVNYFRVSFGKQDLIQESIRLISAHENISIYESRETVFQRLYTSQLPATVRQLRHFNTNVPHWFMSPWFPRMTGESDAQAKERIYRQSQQFEHGCLYALYTDHIELNPGWRPYIIENARLLKDFCYWNLALFLQARNPNVPDIMNKIIKPSFRSPLTTQRNHYWNIVLNELGSTECIYTQKRLTAQDYALEHFIPYSFVAHDQIWNLVPADPSFNSRKSNKLPDLDQYFEPFYRLQQTAFEIVSQQMPKNKLLQDYYTIFPDLDARLDKQQFRNLLQPMIVIASFNGFEFMNHHHHPTYE
jgi:hypothetical protein